MSGRTRTIGQIPLLKPSFAPTPSAVAVITAMKHTTESATSPMNMKARMRSTRWAMIEVGAVTPQDYGSAIGCAEPRGRADRWRIVSSGVPAPAEYSPACHGLADCGLGGARGSGVVAGCRAYLFDHHTE